MLVAQGCSPYFGGPPPGEEGCLGALAVYLIQLFDVDLVSV
jgi:hypothetical protein